MIYWKTKNKGVREMKRKLLAFIFIAMLVFSNTFPNVAFALGSEPPTKAEQQETMENRDEKEDEEKLQGDEQELSESEKSVKEDKEDLEIKESLSEKEQDITEEKEQDTTKEEKQPKQHSEETSKLAETEEAKQQPQAMSAEVGPNLLIDDFEKGLGSWTVSSARANSVDVSISNEFARFGNHSLKIDYDFLNQPGTSGVYASMGDTVEIPGHPKKMSMWVYGDGEKHWLRQMLYDSTGESFNIDYTSSHPNGVTWEGWKYVEAVIPSHWKPPFKIGNQAIRYMATNENAKGKASIYIDNIRAIYEDVEEDTTNPSLSDFSPNDEQVVDSNQPEISVRGADDESGMDFTKTEMKVDGKSVEPTINEEEGVITYVPTAPLAEGLHTVWVNVADHAGNHTFTEWSFMVQTDGPSINWDVDEEIYAGSQFKANISLENGESLAGTTFKLHYDADKLTLEDTDHSQEGVQVDIPDHLQEKVSHYNVDTEAGVIEFSFDELTDITLREQETLIGLSFSLGLDASGDFKLELTEGQYFYAEEPTTAVPFFIAPFLGHIAQPLTLELTGLSLGTPTTMKVVDKEGQPVPDASISVLGGQKLIKVTKPTSIYKGGSGVAGDPYEEVEVGTLLPVAKTPYGGFDFYRIFMPNGEQRYYHVPKDDVEEVDWGTLFGKTNEQGTIETDKLTLSRIGLKLQAVQGDLVSQVESIKISPQLGKETPEHINLTWTDDPKTTQHFSWKTDTFTKGSIVEMRPKEDKTATPLVFEGTSTLFGDQTGEMNLHKVLATGLKPGTTYAYRVGDGSEAGWSDYRTFTTESAQDDPFRFMFMADTQAYDEKGFSLYTDLFELGMNKYPDTKFALHAGDIVENGDKLTEWEYFNEASQGLADQIPLMMVLGNHDVYGEGENFFKNMYSYPQNGPDGKEGFVYSFDYNNARFIMLNSEFGIQDMKEQQAWLREEVESAGDKWTVVMFHRSPYKSNPKRGSDATLDIFAPVMEELDVDLVLTGHDHAYMRSHAMKNGEVQRDGEGTQYIIGGSAGPKFYPGGDEEYVDFMYAEEKQVFTSLLVDGDQITVTAHTDDDELVDEFVLNKREKTPPVDKTALQDLMDEITNANLEAETYTEASWKAFSEAFEAAKSALQNEELTQGKVDELTATLEEKFHALEEEKEENPEQPTPPGEDKPTEPGTNPNDGSETTPPPSGEDPNQNDSGGTKDTGKKPTQDDKDKQGTVDPKDDENETNILPNTSTPFYTIGLIGFALVILGGITFFVYRTRLKKE